RSEKKFNSLDDLKAQIATDCKIARALLRANLTTPTKRLPETGYRLSQS
ncbi:MAG: riboflavin kinase, partial [Prochlorothrix sp.]